MTVMSVGGTTTRQPGIALLSFALGHQEGWAEQFIAHPGVRVTCAWDDDEARGRAAAGRLDVPYVETLEDALGHPEVDAVAICSMVDSHADLAVAAVRAGKHIMMQKPMAGTLADCDRIVEAVEAAGVKYYQSHNLRFDDVHQEVKRLVDEGAIGRIGIARRRHSHGFGLLNPQLLASMGITDPAINGGGCFMDEGAHAALWFLWMFGQPEAVTGMVATSLTEQAPGIEDNGVFTYRYASGMLGVHQSSWTELAAPTTIELFGDQGTIVANGTDIPSSRTIPADEAPLRIWRQDALKPGTGQWEYSPMRLAERRLIGTARAYADMLADDLPSPCDARTGRAAVEMVLAGYQSAREGRVMPLPLRRT